MLVSARKGSGAGLRRLVALQLKEPLKFLEKNIPDLQKMAVAYMPLGTMEELREALTKAIADQKDGKTTLIERLVPELTARGLVVSLIKHSHKHIDIDRPGKDSYRHREAGAS